MQLSLVPISVLLLAFLAGFTQAAEKVEKVSAKDYAYNGTCMSRLQTHIKRELQASITYLAMAAWANDFTVQRPGLAEFFFDSASEEREHALKLLDYLRMRGHRKLEILPSSLEPLNGKYAWENSLSALRQALKMEKDVTESIKKIIDYCAEAEDHQLADYLTGDFMEEQLKGHRNVAGLVNTLQSLLRKQPRLGDWIFDNNLSKSIAV